MLVRACVRGPRLSHSHSVTHSVAHSVTLDCSFSRKDTRFPTIKAHELERLECSVSLLHAFEEARRWDDWEVGVHGISIRFRLGKNAYEEFSATFLPEVASEQGWDVRETMRHLIRKTGCYIDDGEEDGEGEAWVWRREGHGMLLTEVLESMYVERYQSSKASASYLEFLEWIGRTHDETMELKIQ